jgi:hypothetical protein
MASIQTLHGEALPAESAEGAAPLDHSVDRSLAPWIAGRAPEERPVDLLAFALAQEQDLPATPETMARLRERATATLAEYSLRHLHNRVVEIRQEAVLEQFGRLPRPAGFLKLLCANLLALAVAGGLAGWCYLHPASPVLHHLAALVGLIPG